MVRRRRGFGDTQRGERFLSRRSDSTATVKNPLCKVIVVHMIVNLNSLLTGSSPAPPLPNRIGSGKLSAFQPVASSSGSNNLNSSNSSSPSGNGSGIYQHPPPPRHLAAGPATSGNNFTTHYSVQPSVTPPIMFSSQSHHQPNQSAEKRSVCKY